MTMNLARWPLVPNEVGIEVVGREGDSCNLLVFQKLGV